MHLNELVIYKSSAGSGKTFLLVKEYLKLSLGHPGAFRNILAITFTNKATQEMKARILSALTDISQGNTSDMARIIMEETGLEADELREKSISVLKRILHNYSDFSVQTIDSFYSRITRNLSRELNLPYRFNINLDSREVVDNASRMLIDESDHDTELSDWLQEFIIHRIEEGKSWQLIPAVASAGNQTLDDEYYRIFGNKGMPAPDIQFIADLKARISRFRDRMKSFGDEFFEEMEKNGLEISNFSGGKRGPANYFRKISDPTAWRSYVPTSTLLKIIEGDGTWTRKTDKQKEKLDSLISGSVHPVAKKTIAYFEKNFADYTTALAVLQNIHMSGLLSRFSNTLGKLRERDDFILMNDVARIVTEAVGEHDAPFIYEKTGSRYYHYMIDEFQDTSDIQWSNMLPLIENALGTGNSTLLVGDVKQSIYRWRGGNMDLLHQGVQSGLGHLNELVRTEKLNTNYRSCEHIVSFNNSFFHSASNIAEPHVNENWKGLLNEVYGNDGLKQEYKRGDTGDGYVNIRLIKGAKGSSELENASLRELMSRIGELNGSGYSPGDICILVRKNDEASLIMSYLLSHGISNLISAEATYVQNSRQVRFIISLLTLAGGRSDEVNDHYLSRFFHTDLKNDGSSANSYDQVPGQIKKLVHRIRFLSVYEAMEQVLEMMKQSGSADPYIQKLLETALDYDLNEAGGISGYLDWYDLNKEKESCSVVLPENSDSIRIMTIHKAKGLEFPVVIIPFAGWKLSNPVHSTAWLEVDKPPYNEYKAFLLSPLQMLEHSHFSQAYENEVSLNLIDNLNLLYVAFTRAKEKLYLQSSSLEPKDEKVGTVSDIINLYLKNEDTMSPESEHHTSEPETYEVISYELGDESGGPYSYNRDQSPELPVRHAIDEPVSSWQNSMWGVVNKDRISISDKQDPSTLKGWQFHKLMAMYGHKWTDRDSLLSVVSGLQLGENTIELTRMAEDSMEAINSNGWNSEKYQKIFESEILTGGGQVLRPDAVFSSKDHTVVLDYKTGEQHESHHRQVTGYVNELKNMGYENVDGYLYYTTDSKMVRAL